MRPKCPYLQFSGFSALIIIGLVFLFQLSFSDLVSAQGVPRPVPGKRFTDSPGGRESISQNAAYGFDSTLDDLIDHSSTNSNYDSHTLWVLESLTDITQPFWDPYDVDYSRNHRAVAKALTVQGGTAASNLIKGSELKPTFMEIKRGFDEIKNFFKYSVQNSGNGLVVSKNSQGRKLLELNMEFNLSQGLDPQLHIGDNVRFRYDIVNSRPLLEYGMNF